MIWSILIPTVSRRKLLLDSLIYKLTQQVVALSVKDGVDYWEQIQILRDPRDHELVGVKRNDLLACAEGKYVSFFDDDDEPADDYVAQHIKAFAHNTDCVSLRGIMTTDGERPEIFEHSLQYMEWRETSNPIKYERYPNHLNAIRAEIAQRFRFPEKNFGEDHAWSTAIHRAEAIKTEFYIDKILYHYNYRTKK